MKLEIYNHSKTEITQFDLKMTHDKTYFTLQNKETEITLIRIGTIKIWVW